MNICCLPGTKIPKYFSEFLYITLSSKNPESKGKKWNMNMNWGTEDKWTDFIFIMKRLYYTHQAGSKFFIK